MLTQRRGWRCSLAGAAVLGLLAIGALFLPAADPPETDLQFEPASLELGELRTGLATEHCLRFVNRGANPVVITSLQPGCGCMTTRLDKQVYASGESGSIPLSIKTLGEKAGPHTWQLRIHWRSGAVEKEDLVTMRANLVSEINLEPVLITLHCSAAMKHELVLTDQRAQPLRLRGLHTTSPYLVARAATPQQNSAGHWLTRLDVEVSPTCPDGRHEEKLVLTTDDPVYRQLEATVTIFKRSNRRLTTLPASVELQGVSGVPLSRLLQVRDRGGQPVVLTNVTAAHPAVRCTWASGPDNASTVKVQIEPGMLMERELNTQLRIEAEQPLRETLVVPVRCRVQ